MCSLFGDFLPSPKPGREAVPPPRRLVRVDMQSFRILDIRVSNLTRNKPNCWLHPSASGFELAPLTPAGKSGCEVSRLVLEEESLPGTSCDFSSPLALAWSHILSLTSRCTVGCGSLISLLPSSLCICVFLLLACSLRSEAE